MTVRWSHWLLGHAAAWQRDDMRLRELLPRVATLPLGSGEPCLALWGARSAPELELEDITRCCWHIACAQAVHCRCAAAFSEAICVQLQVRWQATLLAWTGSGWHRSWAASAACAPTPWMRCAQLHHRTNCSSIHMRLPQL